MLKSRKINNLRKSILLYLFTKSNNPNENRFRLICLLVGKKASIRYNSTNILRTYNDDVYVCVYSEHFSDNFLCNRKRYLLGNLRE